MGAKVAFLGQAWLPPALARPSRRNCGLSWAHARPKPPGTCPTTSAGTAMPSPTARRWTPSPRGGARTRARATGPNR